MTEETVVLSQETLKGIMFLFKAASFEMESDKDPTGDISLERHRLLHAARAEVLKYIGAVHGGNL